MLVYQPELYIKTRGCDMRCLLLSLEKKCLISIQGGWNKDDNSLSCYYQYTTFVMKIILTIMTSLENNHDEHRDHRHDHNHDHDYDHCDDDDHHHHHHRHHRHHHRRQHHAIMPYV